jgi:hypothetical protein
MTRSRLFLFLAALVASIAAGAAAAPTRVVKIPVLAGMQPCATAKGGRFVWVSGYATPVLLKIDPVTNAVVGRTPIGTGACGLGAGAGSLWIEDTSSNTVSRVSIASGRRTAAVKVGSSPYDATFAYGAAWTAAHGQGDLERIDPGRNKVVRRFPLSGAIGVLGAFGSVWGSGADGLIRVSPESNRIVARVDLDQAGWLAASDDALWVTTPTGVARVDPESGEVVATIPIAGPLGDPAVIDGEVWVPQIRRNRIVVVDAVSNVVTRSVKTGRGPFVVTEIGGDAWIPSWQGNDVWRISP